MRPLPSMVDMLPTSSTDVDAPSTNSPLVTNHKHHDSKTLLKAGPLSPIKDPADSSPRAYSISPRRKAKVRFHPVVQNRKVPHLNDISDAEIEATWITPEEYLAIRKRCITTVKKMMRNQIGENDEDQCPRGLEGKTREGSSRRRENKLDAVAAVLEEQNLQWGEDVVDEESLMEVYLVYAYPCQQSAHQMGLDDHAAIRDYASSQAAIVPPPTVVEEQLRVVVAPQTQLETVVETESTSSSSNHSSVSGTSFDLVAKLKDIIYLQRQRAALLKDIEKNFVEEASIERRVSSRHAPPGDYSKSPMLSQIRGYFASPSTRKERVSITKMDHIPSLHPIHDESPSLEGSSSDEESSSEGSASSETFTSQLHDIFHSRRRRLALLGDIEQRRPSSEVEQQQSSADVSEDKRNSISEVSQALASRLTNMFNSRKSRQAVLNEIDSSSSRRRSRRVVTAPLDREITHSRA